MLFGLDAGSLLIAVSLVVLFAFFFGAALNAIMGEDGFGPLGNTLLFVVGFGTAVYFARKYGYTTHSYEMAAAWGLGGAFVLVGSLALAKAAIAKL